MHGCAAGPIKCYALAVVQRVGKTLGDTGLHLKATIRHANPVLCTQRSMGSYLITRFTLQQEPFPDPTSPEWQRVYLWPGQDPMKALGYDAHNAAYSRLFSAAEVRVLKKVTHAPRVFGPRKAKDGGAPDAVSCGDSCAWQPNLTDSPRRLQEQLLGFLLESVMLPCTTSHAEPPPGQPLG